MTISEFERTCKLLEPIIDLKIELKNKEIAILKEENQYLKKLIDRLTEKERAVGCFGPG